MSETPQSPHPFPDELKSTAVIRFSVEIGVGEEVTVALMGVVNWPQLIDGMRQSLRTTGISFTD